MIHLSPCPRTVVILILLHGLSGPLPFLLERLSVLCSYWHLSTRASAVNTDNRLHLKTMAAPSSVQRLLLCGHFMLLFEYSQGFTEPLIWSRTVVCADIKPPGAGLILTARPSMNVAISSPAVPLWTSFIFMRQANPCFNCVLQYGSQSQLLSVFPSDWLRNCSTGLEKPPRDLMSESAFADCYLFTLFKNTSMPELVAAGFRFHLNYTLSFSVRPCLTFKHSHLPLLRFGCRRVGDVCWISLHTPLLGVCLCLVYSVAYFLPLLPETRLFFYLGDP